MSACKLRCLPATAGSLALLFLAVSASAQAPRVVVQAAESGAGGVARGLQAAGHAITGLNNKVEKHFTVTGRPVVTVQNAMGHIEVKAWDRHEVLVVAQRASNQVQTSTEQVGDRIEITSMDVSSGTGDAGGLETDYVINVPTESELQVHTDSGNVTVESVHGDMSFDTVTGDLTLRDVQGYMLIKTISGSLVCTRCAGRIDASSISGSFQLLQPAMNNVRLQTSSGNIFFDGNFSDRGIYVLRNYSGTIEVRFSSKDSIDVRAASLYGSVISQAPVVQDKHRLRLSSPSPAMPSVANSLIGSLNQGQAKVELSSFSGIIKILKRN